MGPFFWILKIWLQGYIWDVDSTTNYSTLLHITWFVKYLCSSIANIPGPKSMNEWMNDPLNLFILWELTCMPGGDHSGLIMLLLITRDVDFFWVGGEEQQKPQTIISLKERRDPWLEFPDFLEFQKKKWPNWPKSP